VWQSGLVAHVSRFWFHCMWTQKYMNKLRITFHILFLTAFLKHSGDPYKIWGPNVSLTCLRIAMTPVSGCIALFMVLNKDLCLILRPKWLITWPTTYLCLLLYLLKQPPCHFWPPQPTHIGACLIVCKIVGNLAVYFLHSGWFWRQGVSVKCDKSSFNHWRVPTHWILKL